MCRTNGTGLHTKAKTRVPAICRGSVGVYISQYSCEIFSTLISSIFLMTAAVDPNFKSSLPPRKRAKTQEEKEQRRVERILRNRRAAHASREKKRKHVEYLEAYVQQLENNVATISANFKTVSDALPANLLKSLDLPQPEDLSELRAQIRSNLSTVPAGSPSKRKCDFDDEDDEDDERASVASDFHVKTEDVDGLLAPTGSYFNYLSPVSINSPANSPIDLTLKPTEAFDFSQKEVTFSSVSTTPNTPELSTLHSDGLLVDSATSGIDFMAQNSEVILSPRVLMV